MATDASAAFVPPHSVEAEQAVLGAFLLADATLYEFVVRDGLRPEDFYLPRHRAIFDAILRLYDKSQPTDVLLVAEELRRESELENVGGVDAVQALAARVGNVGALRDHGRVVRELGMLRRLLGVTYEVQEAVQAGREEPTETVRQAQKRVLAVDDQSKSQEFRRIGQILGPEIDRLEKLESGELSASGTLTGFRDLDELTGGLQPGALVIIAARPAMGKSAFVTNVAENVSMAKDNPRPVALFSLEMAERELVQRFMASQASIKGDDIRRARLRDRWPKIVQTATRIQDAPLYVDDSSDIGVMEIRAKAQRLKMDHPEGVGVIIIDYLQLLRPDGRIESRVQQVGEMSRGLKILAQEMECPVIALSQLSRGVESRPDKRPMLSDLRECVTGETRVALADGRHVPIAELVGTTPEVLAVDEDRHVVAAGSDRVWAVGERDVLRLRLASGRTLRATAEHRILAGSGWRTLGDLAPGDRVALARGLPEPPAPVAWDDDHVALLGHLVGDGSYLSGQPLRYTTACEASSALVARVAREAFGCRVSRHEGRGAWHQLVIAGNGTRRRPAGVNAWLRGLGVWDQRSAAKRLPREALALDDRQVGVLLRHLWATDGTLWTGPPRVDGRVMTRVAFTTASRGLADDVALLLLRLGIVARLTRTDHADGGRWWTVVVSGTEAQRCFLERVGAFGPCAAKVDAMRAALDGREATTNVDTLPVEVWGDVRDRMRERGVTQRAMAAARGTAHGGTSHFRSAPSRATLASYAELLEAPELAARAEDDLFWDTVVEVVPDGREAVYDLTVPGPSCWLAEGIVTHNSGNIEQDADLVMFLYRDEYYHEDSAEPGVAELIVAKNRSGGLDRVRLMFQREYPRFLTMDRQHGDYG